MVAGGKLFFGVLAFIATTSVGTLAFIEVASFVKTAPPSQTLKFDYVDIATISLTTISVLFTISAIILTVIGIIGYRNLIEGAGRFAKSQALDEIAKAFATNGDGTARIAAEMARDDGPHRKFVESRVRSEVISLMPLIADRLNKEALEMSLGDPSDQGNVD